jgi:two-component system OmpR family sensor kinase
MTLRARLGVAALLVVGVLVAAGWLLPRTVRTSEIEQVDRQLVASIPVAVAISSGERPPEVGSRVPPFQRLPRASSPLSQVYVAHIVDGSRKVLARPQTIGERDPELPISSVSRQRGARPVAVTVPSVQGAGSWRAVLLQEPSGSRVLVAVSLDAVDATIRRMTTAVALAGLAVLLAMGFAGWWLLRLGFRPIADVTAVADAIAGGDRTRRVRQRSSGTEAAHLARAFNVMLDELQATEDRLRQFVADASHELRTPVTAIGGFADLWRQGALEPAEVDQVMRRIGQESGRMRGLVLDLMLLARLDEGQRGENSPVDLSAIAGDAVLDASATHPSRVVTLESPGPVVVPGVENELRQVIANLVTNALVHTELSTAVCIRIDGRSDVAVLSVIDEGAGMAAEDARHAFDRFWRLDPGRTGFGSGLGLAIVRGIVEAHAGKVDLISAPDAGTTVRVRLPYDGVESRISG